MTDEDRYGRKLGKKFEGIRARLCSPADQESAINAASDYMFRQFLKEIPQLADWFAKAAGSLESRNSLFEDVELLDRLKKTTNGSVAEDHFIQSMKGVIERGEDSRDILRDVAARGIDSYDHMLNNQTGYVHDTACQQAFATLSPEIQRCFTNRLLKKAGLALTVIVTVKPKEDTRSLLDLQVVRGNQ